MALSTYSDLQASLSAWLDNSDFAGREADFITLCEDEINARLASGLDEGRTIRPMMQTDPLTIDEEYVDLPDGNTVKIISLEVTGIDRPWKVDYISPENLVRLRFGQDWERESVNAQVGSNPPRYFTLIGDRLRFFPEPEASFDASITRFLKIPALSDDVTTNWVLASHRNCYLYGSLAQAEMFGWKADGMATWATLFTNAMDGLIARYPVATDQTPLSSELDAFSRGGMSYASFMSGSF